MSETHEIGGKRTTIEAKGLNCLEEVKVKEPPAVALSDEKIAELVPLVKRALEIAADQTESWLKEAISADDSGLTISYHLVWSAIPDEAKPQQYVTEGEFEDLCKEVDEAVRGSL